MRFAIIGTGAVGRTLAAKLISLGHHVTLGSRTRDNAAATEWAQQAGPYGHAGTFADAAEFGELVINATAGTVSLQALRLAGADRLAGKVLIDVSNPLVFAPDGEVTLDPVNTDSIGEQIQREFPDTRVVKALNTLSAQLMVDPGRVPGEHNVFIAGDDLEAKAQVRTVLEQFGWPAAAVIDLGGITAARCTEMLMPFWLTMMRHVGHTDFNYSFKIAE
ncbi:NAD(P)-binding domain-containing protein [Kitasatospora sp. GP82]|uniref:NADPH-dependent F420 reductase n=1 Tax=Kitasatospora sp. GP82 TaxID=3035089 RepID=UPI00247613F2|nr:NAD(P)-binding domain-containing protein [Kitasatospora sp. GP82]MDH6124920.1 putative dinucleotide-binding enzyme [Kitasatospora sp. GP82]